MGYYRRVVFIVTESHMMSNYSFLKEMLEQRSDEVRVIYLSVLKQNRKNRLFYGKRILNQAKEIISSHVGDELNDTLIIYSNGEGFLLYNREKWLPNLRNCKEVFLLHGVLASDHNMVILRLKNIANYITKLIIGYGIWGPVFGAIKADNVIVLGDIYKRMLIKEGWDEKKILVAGNLLKPKYEQVNIDNNKCLLLLQGLSPAFMNESEMLSLYSKIVNVLAQYYETVIVRKHPKMAESFVLKLKSYSFVQNVVFSNKGLFADILSVGRVYSCMSAALIDAFIAGREVVAIKDDNIPFGSYKPFQRVVDLKDLAIYLRDNRNSDSRAIISPDYYRQNNVESTINNILEK